jgi:hypothetical protein
MLTLIHSDIGCGMKDNDPVTSNQVDYPGGGFIGPPGRVSVVPFAQLLRASKDAEQLRLLMIVRDGRWYTCTCNFLVLHGQSSRTTPCCPWLLKSESQISCVGGGSAETNLG